MGGLGAKLRRRRSEARACVTDRRTRWGRPFQRVIWSCPAIEQQLSSRRDRLGAPGIIDGLEGRFDGGALHHVSEERDRGRPVGHRMVDLHHHRDPGPGQTLEDQKLPEGPVPSQRRRRERGHCRGELVVAARMPRAPGG